MYRDSYEYKCYKKEYDAYEDEKEELIRKIEKEEEKEMKNTKIEKKLKEAYNKVQMSLFALSKSDTFIDLSAEEWYNAEENWIEKDRDLVDIDRCLKEEELLHELDKNHDFNGYSIHIYEEFKKEYDKLKGTYLMRSVIKHHNL